MTNTILYTLCGVCLFGIGFQGVVLCGHLIRRVIALNLMASGVFLVLIALGHGTPTGQPDPVPQAMVLTGVVVSVSATALALVLIQRLHRETGQVDLPSTTKG